MTNRQPDEIARKANVDMLKHVWQHALDSLDKLTLTLPVGFYAQEQAFIIDNCNALRSIVNQIGNLIKAIESKSTHPETYGRAKIGTHIHQAIERELNSSFPREAITYAKDADYAKIHKKLGCPGCKHAQSQYIGIGPACSKRDKQEQVDNSGKCIDLNTTRR